MPRCLTAPWRCADMDFQAARGPVSCRPGLRAGEGAEIGAGWKRSGEKAGEYVALLIDDPTFPHPIRANLFRDDDAGKAWSLHWSRPRDRAEKD